MKNTRIDKDDVRDDVRDDVSDLSWATVLKRTLGFFLREERPNMVILTFPTLVSQQAELCTVILALQSGEFIEY